MSDYLREVAEGAEEVARPVIEGGKPFIVGNPDAWRGLTLYEVWARYRARCHLELSRHLGDTTGRIERVAEAELAIVLVAKAIYRQLNGEESTHATD